MKMDDIEQILGRYDRYDSLKQEFVPSLRGALAGLDDEGLIWTQSHSILKFHDQDAFSEGLPQLEVQVEPPLASTDVHVSLVLTGTDDEDHRARSSFTRVIEPASLGPTLSRVLAILRETRATDLLPIHSWHPGSEKKTG